MKEYVICFTVLLIGINSNSGHTLSRIELNNLTDAYEVKEGQSTLTITHPKDSKPTLREIVYFHVIEKPYEDQVEQTSDLNKRYFSNGHGYQYVEGNDDVIDDTDAGDDDDETPVAAQNETEPDYDGDENEIEAQNTESTDTKDEDDDRDNDDSQELTDDDNDTENGTINDTEDHIDIDDEDIKNDTEDPINTNDVDLTNDDNDKENGTINETDDDNDKENGTINETDDPIDIDDDIKKPEDELNVGLGDLDDSPINYESSDIQAQPERRRKREIDYKNLPAAPELPEFKLDILPDYIKAIIFADQDADNNTNESDNIEDEIEKQVPELEMAVNHPPSVERDNDRKKKDAKTLDNHLEVNRKDENTEATYGMSLTGNIGKVWNNVNAHHLHYISEPETLTSTISKQKAKDRTTKASIATVEQTTVNIDNNDINKPNDLINDLKDIEDSLDEINNLLEELKKYSTIEAKTPTSVTTGTAFDNNNEEDSFDIDTLAVKDSYGKKGEARMYNNGQSNIKTSLKREARTYGMSLAGDSGVVWNDVNTHVSYHVGEPETIQSTTSIPEEVTDSLTNIQTAVTIDTSSDDKNKGDSKEPIDVNDSDELIDIGDSLDEINNLLEELINKTNEAQNKTTSTDKSTNVSTNNDDSGDSEKNSNGKDSDHLKDIEDSFDEVNKLFEELIKNSTSETTTESENDTSKKPNVNGSTTIATTEETITESTPTVATSTEATTIEVTTTYSTNLDETPDKSTTTQKPNKNKIDDKNNDRKHNNGTRDNEDTKQKQFVKELMKNKFFWQWLQDSSTAYLEVLMKKLDVLIKEEVDKQIKQYFKEHENVTNCKPNNEGTQNNSVELFCVPSLLGYSLEEPIQSNNATDIDTIVTTERPTANNTLENENETSTQNPIVSTEPNSALNNTIYENENNSNKTENDLAKKQNKESYDKKDKAVKIEANNVYGNSVGNGKVTNIFIFNISKESDLENIKPLNNGTNGVFVFGIDDKKQNEGHKNYTSKDINKPETTNDHKDNENNIKNPDINQVTTTQPQTIEPASEEPKDNIDDSTTENAVTDKQTTSTESSKTTTISTYVDNESSTTEKVTKSTIKNIIESTTEEVTESTTAKIKVSSTEKMEELTTEAAKESSTEKMEELTTEAAKESSTEISEDDSETGNAKPEQDKPNESHESSTIENGDVDDKPTENSTSLLNDTTDGADKTQEPSKELDNATSTTENAKSNEESTNVDTTNDKEIEDKTEKVQEKENTEIDTTESTKISEVTTDEIDTGKESTKEKDKNVENEVNS